MEIPRPECGGRLEESKKPGPGAWVMWVGPDIRIGQYKYFISWNSPASVKPWYRCVTCYPNKLRALRISGIKPLPPSYLCKILKITCYNLSFFCKLSCRQLQYSTTWQRQSDMNIEIDVDVLFRDFTAVKQPGDLSYTTMQTFGPWNGHNEVNGVPSYLTQPGEEGTRVIHTVDMPLWVTIFHILLIVHKQPAKNSIHGGQN